MRKKITSNTRTTKNSRRSGYSINALPYSLSIKKPLTVSTTKKPFKYMGKSDFVEAGRGCSSLRDFLLKFLESMEEPLIDDVAYSGMRISKKDIDKSNSSELRCVIRAGKYGYESELYDIKTRLMEIKSQSKCDMLPLLCRIVFNEEHQNCIVIFEKLKTAGTDPAKVLFFSAFLMSAQLTPFVWASFAGFPPGGDPRTSQQAGVL